MPFQWPLNYNLIIGLQFPNDWNNERVVTITEEILNFLEGKLEPMPHAKLDKNLVKKSIRVVYFSPRERQFDGAAKEFKILLKKIKRLLDKLKIQYPEINFLAYIYNDINDFFGYGNLLDIEL